ncbi:reverse transcriptase domain-containing protein [Tanacetum coccineum]
MPKELKNSAATLQRIMEKVLTDQRGWNVEIYLEEIVIKSKSEPDLVQDVKETLRKLKRVNIKIDQAMSSFEVKQERFLGYIITDEGLRADPRIIQAIILSPILKSPNQIRSLFLQLTAISKFILKLAELKHPLREAQTRIKITKVLDWTNEAEEAFRRIKRKLGKLPMLAIPKEGEDLMICLWQRNETISFVLLVKREGAQIPISYVSRPLQGMEI